MSHHPVEDSNSSDNVSIDTVLQNRLSRRKILVGGVSATVAYSFLGSALLTGCGSSDKSDNADDRQTDEPLVLGFAAVAKSLADRVVLPGVGAFGAALEVLRAHHLT